MLPPAIAASCDEASSSDSIIPPTQLLLHRTSASIRRFHTIIPPISLGYNSSAVTIEAGKGIELWVFEREEASRAFQQDEMLSVIYRHLPTSNLES
ncbi:hypothetical protein LXL04_000401 [Taraxacum kok-saghyz]